MTDTSERDVLVAFARLEGKVELALSELASLKGTGVDHENRIRVIEQQPIPDSETDKRIRALEDRRTVTTGQLWFGLIGVLGVGATILAIVNDVLTVTGIR